MTAKNICWICCDSVHESDAVTSEKLIKLPNGYRVNGGETVERICELLDVEFKEFYESWRSSFGGGGGGGGRGRRRNNLEEGSVPFCLSCLTDFQSIVQLEEELKTIQKRINDGIDNIRDRIRETSTNKNGPAAAMNFRLKVLTNDLSGSRRTSTKTEAVPSTASSISSYLSLESSTVNNGKWSSTSLTPHQSATFSDLLTPPTTSTDPQIVITSTSSSNANYLTETEVKPAEELQEDLNYFDDDHNNDYGVNSDSGDSPEENSEESEPETKVPPKKVRRNPSKISQENEDEDANQLVDAFKRSRQAETFTPTYTDHLNRLIFEGIPILPSNPGYSCGQCGTSYGTSQNSIALRKVKIHIKGVHLLCYKCPLCSKNFSSNDILNQHLNHSHSKVNCPICQKPLKKPTLKHHQFSHMNAEEKADAIAKGYKIPEQTHIKYQKEPHLSCRICDKMFHTPSRLKRHEATHVDSEFRKDFKCDHCEKGYTTAQALRQHIVTSHQPENSRKKLCKVCGQSIYWKHLKGHMKVHLRDAALGGPPFICKNCESVFQSRQGYSIHVASCSKTGEAGDFQCDICRKFFKTKKILRGHRVRVHRAHWKNQVPIHLKDNVTIDNPGEEPLDDLNNEGIQWEEGDVYTYQLYKLEKMTFGYKCCTCLEEIINEEGEDELILEEMVINHVKSQHLGAFRCNLCSKRMKSLFEVQCHQRLEHLKLSGYDCEICGRSAIPDKMVKKHRWLHKSVWELAETVNLGEVWPRPWRGPGEMEEILEKMGVELNHKCGICEREGFDKVEELYKHRLEEHKDAPVHKVNINKELKKSGGGKKKKAPEGPQDCPECGKTFGDRRKVTRHVYKVHTRKKKGGGGANKRKGSAGTAKGPAAGKAPKRKKMEVDSEEEVEIEDDEVEVKMEVVTPENSDLEEDGGESGRSLVGMGLRRSARRSSARNIKYIVEEEDDEVDIKQQHSSSESSSSKSDYD